MADEEVKTEDKQDEVIELNPVEEQVEPEKPTLGELKQRGWTEAELEQAQKRGMIAEEKDGEEKKEPEHKEETKEEGNKEPSQKKDEKPQKREGKLPNFDLSPEQEQKFKELFGEGTEPWAMYVGMKRNRRSAQEAKEERDRLLLEMKHRDSQIEDLRQQMNLLIQGKKPNEDEEPEEEKPLTASQLKKMREEEQKQQQELTEKQKTEQAELARAIQRQDEAMRDRFGDFDETLKLAADLYQKKDEYFDDPIVLDEIDDMMRQVQFMAKNATKFSPDRRNASYIAYKLGQLHPEYGKPDRQGKRAEDKNGNENPEKANGGLTPDQMERINKNATRRSSSASVSGGSSKRVINPEDVTQDDLLHMSRNEPNKFREFRTKYPKRYNEIVHG